MTQIRKYLNIGLCAVAD